MCALKITNLVPLNFINDVHFYDLVALCGKESHLAVSNLKEKRDKSSNSF